MEARRITTHLLRPFNRSSDLRLLVFATASFNYFAFLAVLFNLCLLRLALEPQFIGLLIGSGNSCLRGTARRVSSVGVHGALIAGLVLIGLAYALLRPSPSARPRTPAWDQLPNL